MTKEESTRKCELCGRGHEWRERPELRRVRQWNKEVEQGIWVGKHTWKRRCGLIRQMQNQAIEQQKTNWIEKCTNRVVENSGQNGHRPRENGWDRDEDETCEKKMKILKTMEMNELQQQAQVQTNCNNDSSKVKSESK